MTENEATVHAIQERRSGSRTQSGARQSHASFDGCWFGEIRNRFKKMEMSKPETKGREVLSQAANNSDYCGTEIAKGKPRNTLPAKAATKVIGE